MFDVPDHKPNGGPMHVAEDRPTGYSVSMALKSPPVARGDADHFEGCKLGRAGARRMVCVCVGKGVAAVVHGWTPPLSGRRGTSAGRVGQVRQGDIRSKPCHVMSGTKAGISPRRESFWNERHGEADGLEGYRISKRRGSMTGATN